MGIELRERCKSTPQYWITSFYSFQLIWQNSNVSVFLWGLNPDNNWKVTIIRFFLIHSLVVIEGPSLSHLAKPVDNSIEQDGAWRGSGRRQGWAWGHLWKSLHALVGLFPSTSFRVLGRRLRHGPAHQHCPHMPYVPSRNDPRILGRAQGKGRRSMMRITCPPI